MSGMHPSCMLLSKPGMEIGLLAGSVVPALVMTHSQAVDFHRWDQKITLYFQNQSCVGLL